MSRTCHSLTRQDTTPGPRGPQHDHLNQHRTEAARELGDGPMAPGARSQPNKLARTAMFVLTRSRCSQSAGKVPTCEAACQRRWACTSRGDLLCHQRPGPDRRPDRRQNGVRARRCAAAVWRAALCEGKLGGRASPHLATRRSCSVWVSQLAQLSTGAGARKTLARTRWPHGIPRAL